MDRKVGQPNIWLEVVVVFAVGALGSIGHVYVAIGVQEALEDPESVYFSLIAYALEPVILVFVLWLGYSVGLHLIANRVFNARGPIRRLFKLTAWALVPLGVAYALRSVVLFLVYRTLEMEQVLAGDRSIGWSGALDAVVSEGTADPLYLLAPVLLLGGVLASAYLLVYAVQETKDLDRDAALRVVAVPAGVHSLYVLWTLVTLAGNAL